MLKKFIQTALAKAGRQLCRRDLIALYPLMQFDRTQLSRLLYFFRFFDRIKNVPGDIVECGMGQLRTFHLLALLLEREGQHRKLWGFDSFEGFPEPTAEDRSPRNPKKGEWKVLTLPQAHRMLELIRLPQEFIDGHIQIVKGFFNDTLQSAPIQSIAILHLDVDLYDSYRTCLRELFPKVVPGGLVLFDEYGSTTTFPGAKRAIDEYFSGTSHAIEKDDETGKFFVVK